MGAGFSFSGFYGYLGPVVSYRVGIFEPYAVERFNYVSFPQDNYPEANTGELQVIPGTYRYFQHTLGFLIWPTRWFGFGLEGSYFSPVASNYVLNTWNHFVGSGNASSTNFFNAFLERT